MFHGHVKGFGDRYALFSPLSISLRDPKGDIIATKDHLLRTLLVLRILLAFSEKVF